MDPAWIGVAGALAAAAFSAMVAKRQSVQDARLQAELAKVNGDVQAELARLNGDLQVEIAARTTLMQREQAAEDVLKMYREPLAAAAFDLQSRLYNILCMEFFSQFGGSHNRCRIAETTTLFRIAQYFGWTEILRRDIQFLSFPEADETRRVVTLQSEIAKRFGTSKDDHGLMIWTDEQRAIGERMIVEEYGKVLCMGYARFDENYERLFSPWCERMRPELHSPTGHERLRDLQHLLCDLVLTLDAGRVRYTQDLRRA